MEINGTFHFRRKEEGIEYKFLKAKSSSVTTDDCYFITISNYRTACKDLGVLRFEL